MEGGITLNALGGGSSVCASPRGIKTAHRNNFFSGLPLLHCRRINALGSKSSSKTGGVVLVQAKGKKGMQGRLYPQRPVPSLPKAEDDNPRFLLFVRTKNVPRWYPINIITGGTTAKLMVAAKNTPIGKGLYESTLTRNIAAVVYKDVRAIRKAAVKQFPLLKSASEFQYGYKLIDEKNQSSAFSSSDIVKIPPQEELKTVVEKVKDFFGNAISGVKESFGGISSLNVEEEDAAASDKKQKKEAGTTTS